MRGYRGKRLDGKGWVYGDLVHKPRDKFDSGIRTFIYKAVGEDCGWFEVDPATVEQQVGLKDKNGIEAYNGDRYISNLFWDTTKDTHVVFTIRWVKNGFKAVDERHSIFEIHEEFEIIHDNPELMEVK